MDTTVTSSTTFWLINLPSPGFTIFLCEMGMIPVSPLESCFHTPAPQEEWAQS